MSGRGDRVALAACLALVAFATLGRWHNAGAYPAMRDWDAGSHAVNVVELHEGRLPDVRTWSGSHPPLYYAVGAGLWTVLPVAIPVHVLLRLVSSSAWLATLALAWRVLRGLGYGVDAAVATTLVLGVPGFAIASGMMTNDVLGVLFTTAVLARLVAAARAEAPASAVHAAGTAALAGLAALTKATGLAAVAVTGIFYAWQARRRIAPALRNVGVVGFVTLVMLAPHYGRLALARAAAPPRAVAPASPYHVPPYDFLAGFSDSAEKEAISLVVLDVMAEAYPSPARLLHEAIWGDPTAVFLPRTPGGPMRLLRIGGILIEALALGGVVHLLRRRTLARRAAPVVAFGAAYGLAIVPPCIVAPYMVLTKTNFLLPLALPLALVLAAGLTGLRGSMRAAARALALAVAAAGLAVTWYGWWEPRPAGALGPAVVGAELEPPAVAVGRYVRERARDPIRAVARVTPAFHDHHDLRLVRILRVPFPDGRLPATADALELARARHAWLDLYNLVRWLQPVAAASRVTVLDVDARAAAATVRIRIEALGDAPPPGAAEVRPWPFPALEQRVELVRAAGEWRIARITQTGVSVANAVAAFAANPTLAGLDDLRALGWRPDWEAPVARALRGAS